MIAAPQGVQNPAYKFSQILILGTADDLRRAFLELKNIYFFKRVYFQCFIFVNFAHLCLQKIENRIIIEGAVCFFITEKK